MVIDFLFSDAAALVTLSFQKAQDAVKHFSLDCKSF